MSKNSISGSAVNEIQVSSFEAELKNNAKILLAKFKQMEIENPKKYIKTDEHTIQSIGFFSLMEKRTKIRRKF